MEEKRKRRLTQVNKSIDIMPKFIDEEMKTKGYTHIMFDAIHDINRGLCDLGEGRGWSARVYLRIRAMAHQWMEDFLRALAVTSYVSILIRI